MESNFNSRRLPRYPKKPHAFDQVSLMARPLWFLAGPLGVVPGAPLLDALWIRRLALACFGKDSISLRGENSLAEAGDLLFGALDGLHVGRKGSLG